MDEHQRAEILKKTSLDVVEAKSDALKLSLEEVEILESRCKSKAEKVLKELCEKFGVFKNFYKKDINLEFNYSKSSLGESSHKQYERNPTYSDFAIMLSMFDSIISNAQPIEVHTDKYAGTKREDTNLKQSYVLISAFKNGEFVVPVEINIKEFKNDQENKMHMTVTLKKIRADILAPATNSHSHQSTPSTLNISIADLIKNVNPSDSDFLRYVPDEMLNEAQIEAKMEALEKDRQKIESLKKSVAGTRVVDNPSVSKAMEPYIDSWGRQKVTENIFVRAFQNMLSPGYYSKVKTSGMEKELKRLYDSVGNEERMSLFPSKAVNKFRLSNGTEKSLTAREYTKMQEVQGKTAYKLLTGITESDVYAEFDDITKGKIITNAYELSKANAKKSEKNCPW